MYEFVKKFKTIEDLIIFIFQNSLKSADYFIGLIDYVIANNILTSKKEILKFFYYYCCENDYDVLFKKIVEKYNFRPHWYSHVFIEDASEKKSFDIVKFLIYDNAILSEEYSTLSEDDAILLDEFDENEQFKDVIIIKNNNFFRNLVLHNQIECIDCIYRQHSNDIIHNSCITSNLIFNAIKEKKDIVLKHIIHNCNYPNKDIYYMIHKCLRLNLEKELKLYIDALISKQITFPIKILFIGDYDIINYILDNDVIKKPINISNIVDIFWTSKFGNNNNNYLNNSIPFVKFAIKNGYELLEDDLTRLISIQKYSFVLDYLRKHPNNQYNYATLFLDTLKQNELKYCFELILFLLDKCNINDLLTEDSLENILKNISFSKTLLFDYNLDVNIFDGYILKQCLNIICFQQIDNKEEYIELLEKILETPNIRIIQENHFTKNQFTQFLKNNDSLPVSLDKKIIKLFQKHNFNVWYDNTVDIIEKFYKKYGRKE